VFADEYHSQSLFEAAPQLLQVSGFLGARQNTLGDQSQVDDADTPLDETLEAYAQLIQQGKVRAIGASNYNPKRLGEAAADPQEKRPGAVRESAAALQPLRAGGVRNGVSASLPARKHRRDSLLFAGQRISCGQVPFRSRFAHERERDFREEISERARFQNPGRARASVSSCLSSLIENWPEGQCMPRGCVICWKTTLASASPGADFQVGEHSARMQFCRGSIWTQVGVSWGEAAGSSPVLWPDRNERDWRRARAAGMMIIPSAALTVVWWRLGCGCVVGRGRGWRRNRESR
jgi:hypothetical protein